MNHPKKEALGDQRNLFETQDILCLLFCSYLVVTVFIFEQIHLRTNSRPVDQYYILQFIVRIVIITINKTVCYISTYLSYHLLFVIKRITRDSSTTHCQLLPTHGANTRAFIFPPATHT